MLEKHISTYVFHVWRYITNHNECPQLLNHTSLLCSVHLSPLCIFQYKMGTSGTYFAYWSYMILSKESKCGSENNNFMLEKLVS